MSLRVIVLGASRLLWQNRKRFAHLSPDFVIETRSENDTVERLQAKRQAYQANGVRLGWLIDPQQEQVWMYRADGTIAKVDFFAEPLSGEEGLPDLGLTFAPLRKGEGKTGWSNDEHRGNRPPKGLPSTVLRLARPANCFPIFPYASAVSLFPQAGLHRRSGPTFF